MATTNQSKNPNATLDGLFERTSDAQEQFTSAYRKAGNAYLDSYEKVVDRAIEFELKLADSTGQDWVRGIVETQANFAREVAGSYTSTARTLLK